MTALAAPVVNLVNLEDVRLAYGTRVLLDGVSLGVGDGDRIGVVGRNGGGKTTLLEVLARTRTPDAGRVTHTGGLRVGCLSQDDRLPGVRHRPGRGGRRQARPRLALGRPYPGGRRRPARSGSTWTPRSVRCPAASAGGSRSRRCSWTTPTCCCSTSRPTISTSRASTGWPGHLAARRGALVASPTTAGSSTRSADLHVGGRRRCGRGVRRRLRGVRAGQEPSGRAADAAEERRQQPAAQGARLAASRPAGPHVQAEVPHRRGQRADRRRAAAARHRRADRCRGVATRPERLRRRGRHRRAGRSPAAATT